MDNFTIAIPSYNRADNQTTLEYLSSIGIPKNNIFIFVQTPEDYEAYQKYAGVSNIVEAEAHTVTQARNNILRYFSRDVLMLDDDIRKISILKNGKLAPITNGNTFIKILGRCFEHTKKSGGSIFGIYPVHNEYFMSQTISTKVTVNTVLGFVADQPYLFDEKFKAKEDIEMCARILHGGGKVYRHNYLAVDAKHRTNAGGCKEAWHTGENEKAVKRLCVMYPEILVPKKKEEVKVIVKDKKIALAGGRK